MKLVQNLFSGSIDVIGDIHGEFLALKKLLAILGYNREGVHPEGRRLVFIGDLVDRGPDSISVVDLVQNLMRNNVAQCVAGNHELNILKSQRGKIIEEMRHGNHWYFGKEEALDKSTPDYVHPQKLATPEDREHIHEFFLRLPLVLQDANYLMVHAAWNPKTHGLLKDYDEKDVAPTSPGEFRNILHAYTYFSTQISQETENLTDKMGKELAKQNNNPIKVCTSGIELAAQKTFYIKGKVRYTKRAIWWKAYEGDKQIIFGHYWRKLPPSVGIKFEDFTPPKERKTPNPFDGTHYGQWLQNSMCIDYSVGGRYYDRQKNIEEGHSGKCLCALRITRKDNELGTHQLFFDTGQQIAL